mgnify:CR=1 FL=1
MMRISEMACMPIPAKHTFISLNASTGVPPRKYAFLSMAQEVSALPFVLASLARCSISFPGFMAVAFLELLLRDFDSMNATTATKTKKSMQSLEPLKGLFLFSFIVLSVTTN